MMRLLRIVVALALVPVVTAAIYVWRSQWPLIDKIEPPPRSAFSQALIDRGARLAAVGDCHVCHTAPDGAGDYAGNRPIPTPFGTVYSTNVTPAPGSGIGHWSEAAFRRAMRQGISRQGRHLYPAFPYVHFARLSDADIHALYAFLMTRRPIETTQLPNRLPFPLDQRWLIGFWNLLFFHPAPFRADPQHDAEWNRGAYLVRGLGHCGDCHTPRNFLGAEEGGRPLAGGEGEGWAVPALDAASPAPAPWDAAQLFQYLRHGWDKEHGAAAGPMQPVADELAEADPADVRAIAAYIAVQQGEPSAPRHPGTPTLPQQPPPPGEALGAALFAGACARCHSGGGEAMLPPHGIDLARSTVVNAADPDDAILIALDGIRQPDERAGPFMPPFAGAFSDAQIAALLAYVRAHFSAGAAWPDLEKTAHDLRHHKGHPPPS
jgi:mono/diheme cytochrome c family protein